MADDLIIDESLDDQPPEGGDIERLTTTLVKVRAEARQYKRAAQKFAGIDPELYRQMVEEKEARELNESTRKGEFDKLLGVQQARAAAAEAKYKDALLQANESMADSQLGAEFIKAGGKPEHVDNYKLLAKSKLTKDEGGAYILPDNTDGEAMQWGDYVATTKDSLGFAFEPNNKSKGSGSTGGKEPPVEGVKYVTPAEASRHLEGIASGKVIVRS